MLPCNRLPIAMQPMPCTLIICILMSIAMRYTTQHPVAFCSTTRRPLSCKPLSCTLMLRILHVARCYMVRYPTPRCHATHCPIHPPARCPLPCNPYLVALSPLQCNPLPIAMQIAARCQLSCSPQPAAMRTGALQPATTPTHAADHCN
jgi:hypothetical protein